MTLPRLATLLLLTSAVVVFRFFQPADATEQLRGPLPSSAILLDGEELVYEVSWTFFKIGTVRLRTRGDYSAEAWIDSYSDLPFVDLHSVHYSWMDSSFFSRGSRSIELRGEAWWGLDYDYDLSEGKLRVNEIYQTAVDSPLQIRGMIDTVILADTNFVDGISIAFFPRARIHTSAAVSVPTVLLGKLGTTDFYFDGSKTTESIEALDDPVRVVEVEGATSVVGVYGMTGAFTGWFSDDSAAVPIKGAVKVLLGDVDVELIQWKRDGWVPPTEP
ncbi:MAG: hypothetical protein WBD30_09510 [Bacteroidota bacterium]